MNHAYITRFLAFADSTLSTEERTHVVSFRSHRASVSYRCGRGLSRLLIGHALNITPQAVDIQLSDLGKPQLLASTGIHFSISHTSSTLLVAISRAGEVGADVEEVSTSSIRGENVRRLAGLHLHPQEMRLIQSGKSHEEQVRLFLLLWTAREAVGKASGIGITKPKQIEPMFSIETVLQNAELLWRVEITRSVFRYYRVIWTQDSSDRIASLALYGEAPDVREFRAEFLFENE